jgi:hypothetical protein
MKVTARDISNLVKDAQIEMMRKRSAEPKESLIDALILDEMQKMTSLVESENRQAAAGSNPEGSLSLDPSAFVDTSNWTGELLSTQSPPGSGTSPGRRTPPNKVPSGKVTRPGMPTASPDGIEGLEAVLEPDRTGVHKRDGESKPPWTLIVLLMLLLAAGAAVAVVVAMQ